MKTADFDYHLPQTSIAQTPLEPRDTSRLLVMDRKTGVLQKKIFNEIGDFLQAGDLLVVNQTRVIPARIHAHKAETGGKIEVLLLKRLDELTWEALIGGRRMTLGKKIAMPNGQGGEIVKVLDGAKRVIHFDAPLDDELNEIGQMPLPPYIHETLTDPDRYQTVYANQAGSAAAPTAGLHFTPRLLDSLQAAGVGLAKVTLHVGLDTFAPVNEDNVDEHIIHTEWCELPAAVAEQIRATKANGGRVIAVGTTSVRTLESAGRGAGPQIVQPIEGPTDLFITPGYTFKVVDAMITNFHLPRSTLLMLVSAFTSRERILNAYQVAIEEKYRFFSFGDAMLIE